MSLRGFHIFFISLVVFASFTIAAAVFALGFNPIFGSLMALFGVAVGIYGAYFIRKTRNLIL